MGDTRSHHDTSKPKLLYHREIILYINLPAHFRRLGLLSEQELLQGIPEAFEDSWYPGRDQKKEVSYTPSFTGASTEKPGKLRVKVSTKSIKHLKLLEEYLGWARTFCCPLEGTKSYRIEMDGMLDVVNFPPSRHAKQSMTETLVEANDWVQEILSVLWRKRPPKKTDGKPYFRVNVASRRSANKILEKGLRFNGKRYRCTLVDDPCFDVGANCARIGHKAEDCGGPHACLNCGEDHEEFYGVKKARCMNCGGGHRADSEDCHLRRMLRELERLPTAEKMLRLVKDVLPSILAKH